MNRCATRDVESGGDLRRIPPAVAPAGRAIRVAGGAKEVHPVTKAAVQDGGAAGGAREGL